MIFRQPSRPKDDRAYLPLATRLRRLLLVSSGVALLVMFLFTGWIHISNYTKQVSLDLNAAATSCSNLIRFYLDRQNHLIARLIDAAPTSGQEVIVSYIQNHIPTLDEGDNYVIIDASGRIVATTPRYEAQFKGIDLSRMEFLHSKRQISRVRQSIFGKESVVIFKYILPGSMTLLVERNIKNLIPIIRNASVASEHVELFVLTETGTVIYHPNPDLVASRKNLLVEFRDWTGPNRYGLYSYRHEGRTYLCAYRELDLPQGWVFYASISMEELLDHATHHQFPLLAMLFILFCVILAVFNATLVRYLTRPVENLARYIEQVDALDRPIRFPPGLAAGTSELKLFLDKIEILLNRIFQATQKVKEREELLRIITESGTDWAYWIDDDMNFLYVSKATEEITGYSPDEFRRRPELLVEIIHQDDRHIFEHHLRHSLGATLHNPLEFRIVTKDGTVKWIRHVCKKIMGDDGEYLGIRGSNMDITRAKEAEKMLSREQQRLATILDTIRDGVLALDREHRVIFANRAATALLGIDITQQAGGPIEEAPIPGNIDEKEWRDIMALVTRAQEEGHVQILGGLLEATVEGETRKVQVIATPVVAEEEAEADAPPRVEGTVLVFNDRTEELKRLAEQSKLEKLQNLGLAAGGIAHDFNNLLTAILGNINLAQMLLGPDHPVTKRIEAAEKACQRARSLTQQLLTFAKGGEPIKEATSLPDLVRDTSRFVLSGSAVTCEYDFPSDLWLMDADPSQLSQVIQNLVINAVQAMNGKGRIVIRAANVTVDMDAEGMHQKEEGLELPPGRYVRLEIEDEGPGIPQDVLDRIFDPYFTTKEGGSGLGLSVCLSIAVRHGGTITVRSRQGQGTRFSVYMPAANGVDKACETTGDGAKKEEQASIPSRLQADESSSRRILLMDDDLAIVELVREGLTHMGYEVTTATRGERAVELYQDAMERGTPFHAAILDLTIAGGMGGVETARRIRELDPEALLIVSTGYSDEAVMNRPELGFKASLPKPYRLEELKRLLEDLLG